MTTVCAIVSLIHCVALHFRQENHDVLFACSAIFNKRILVVQNHIELDTENITIDQDCAGSEVSEGHQTSDL